MRQKKLYLINSLAVLMLVHGLSLHAKLAPVMEWARQMGGQGANAGTAITTDKNGNVYSTGWFEGTADFNPGSGIANFTASDFRDIYISKLDASGDFVWAKRIGVQGTNQGMAITTDTSGNVYIAGEFTGSPDFDPAGSGKTLTAIKSVDAFILKLDAAGNYVWAKNVGSVLSDNQIIAYGIAIDAGNVYITGAASNTGSFIAKLDLSGNFVWTKVLGGKNSNSYAIATDRSGNVYATGNFSGTADFNPDPNVTFNITSTGSREVFISKLDASGNFVWAKSFVGDTTNNKPNTTFGWSYGIKIDPLGNIYTTGYFRGVMDFDPATNSAHKITSVFNDLFISKLDSAGSFIWVKTMDGVTVNSNSLAVDDQGSPYVTGWFNSTTDFDPGTGPADTFNVTPEGNNDIFMVKLDSSGNFAWAKNFGGTGPDYGYNLSVDADKNVYVTGYFQDTVNFDTSLSAEFSSFGDYDIFVLKINQFCYDTSSSNMSVTLCEDQYTLYGQTYDTTGVYTQIYTNTAGCDSTVILNLTLNGKIQQPFITVKEFELSTTGSYSSYQWMLNGNTISGATDSIYTVTQNGDYRVIVTNAKGCKDTSDPYTVNNYTDIQDVNAIAQQVNIYPNPANDLVHIVSPVAVQVIITSIEGKVIKHAANVKAISVKDLATGMYLMRISDKGGKLIKVEKLIRN